MLLPAAAEEPDPGLTMNRRKTNTEDPFGLRMLARLMLEDFRRDGLVPVGTVNGRLILEEK